MFFGSPEMWFVASGAARVMAVFSSLYLVYPCQAGLKARSYDY